MTETDLISRGRELFRQRQWAESVRVFTAADEVRPLEAEDLDLLATAAYLAGRDDESEACRGRAHQRFIDCGDVEGAARAAFWMAFGLLQRGALAPASGWFLEGRPSAGRWADRSCCSRLPADSGRNPPNGRRRRRGIARHLQPGSWQIAARFEDPDWRRWA